MERGTKTESKRAERSVRLVYVTARLTKEERALVDQQALQAGMTVSDWTRQAVLEAAAGIPLATRFLAGEILAVRALLVGMRDGTKTYTTKQIDETKGEVTLQFWQSFRERLAEDGR